MRRSLVIGTAVAVMAGVVVARQFSTSAGTESSKVSTGHPTSTLPAAAARPSPVQAAVAAVSATGEIAKAGFIERRDLIDSIASTRFAPTLASSSASQLSQMTSAIGAVGVAAADVLWQELPLTVRLVSATDTAATVDVWSVLIIGVPGHGAPRQVWRTVTMAMVWERDGWRIDSWTTAAGPTPALASTAPISEVTQLTEVLAWSPVGGDR